MTLTLNSETETRLRTFAEGQGMAPEQMHDALLTHALQEAEAELQNTLDGLDRSMEDLSAGRWITAAEMHQRLHGISKLKKWSEEG